MSKSENLKLIGFSQKENAGGTIYDIDIKFDKIEDMKKYFDFYFVENSIYSEKDTVYCKSRLVLNFLGDPIKLRSRFSGLEKEEKKLISAYLSIIKIQLVYVIPGNIITAGTTSGKMDTEIPVEIPVSVFENDIQKKLGKNESAKLLNYYEKKNTTYTRKNYLSDEERSIADELIKSSGFKNRITYEKTLLDVISSQVDPEFVITYKKR